MELKSLKNPKLPKVLVKDLIEELLNLPQDQEIVLYPKYSEVDGTSRYRFLKENVQEQEQRDGYKYVAIIF